jgi:hypothetical protein
MDEEVEIQNQIQHLLHLVYPLSIDENNVAARSILPKRKQ